MSSLSTDWTLRTIRLHLIRAAVVLTTALVVIVLGESAVRVVAPQDLSGRWSHIGHRGLRINKPNWEARHQRGEIAVTYRLNDHGLRGGPLQDAGRRVLVLGDSFTFGWLLEERDTYVQLLAERADARFGSRTFQFLNGGRGGWGTSDYVAFVEEYGESLQPAVVLVFLNFDDIRRSNKSALYSVTEADALELSAHSVPASRLTKIADALPLYDWLISRSHLVQLARRSVEATLRRRASAVHEDAIGQRTVEEPRPASRDELQATLCLGQGLFRRLHEWCKKHCCELLVVTTGYQGQDASREATNSPDAVFLREAAGFFLAEGVPYHDITPEMVEAVNGQWDAFIIEGDGHANVAGAKLIGDRAWDWVAPQLERVIREAPSH